MRERLCCREKPFFKDALTWGFFCCILVSFFLCEAASSKNEWAPFCSRLPLISEKLQEQQLLYTSLLSSVFFCCTDLAAKPTVNTQAGIDLLHRAGLSKASLLQPYKTSCPSWRAMLGLSLTTNSDVLTLFNCSYLSASTRPEVSRAIARGAATLWKISKGAEVRQLC